MDNKTQDLIKLGEKGGNDATLLLLDKIHALEDKIAQLEAQPVKDLDDEMERIVMKLAIKVADVQKGDKGEKGDSIIGPAGKDGKDGKSVKGDKGESGQDAKLPDIEKLAQEAIKLIPPPDMQTLKDELQEMIVELRKEMKANTEPRSIFGPGKTRIILVDLSSQLNGSKKTFFLGTHYGIVGVDSSSAPFGAFRNITDYNESGKNIVFTASVDAPSALPAGQSLIVRVLK